MKKIDKILLSLYSEFTYQKFNLFLKILSMKTTKDKKNYAGEDLDSMGDARNYYSWIIDEFGKFMSDNVAEVGAGSGTFSKYILKKGVKTFWAVEPSPEMFPLLQDNLKEHSDVNLHNGFFEETLPKTTGKLDTVFYINVLEHVEHDLEELKSVNKALKKGGHVCIYVPALPGIYGSFDEEVGHYRRYTKRDLKKKLTDAGFEVVKLHYSDMVGVFPWFLNFRVLKKRNLSKSQVSIYDKYIIPLIKLQEKYIKSPFGKNLWAVGKKI